MFVYNSLPGGCERKKAMVNTHRSVERKDLYIYLDVVDDATMLQFGHVVDISEEGMKVLCEKSPSIGVIINCTIILPHSLAHLDDLAVSATCRWTAPDINPEFLAVGFEFETLTGMQKLVIQEILKSHSFDKN